MPRLTIVTLALTFMFFAATPSAVQEARRRWEMQRQIRLDKFEQILPLAMVLVTRRRWSDARRVRVVITLAMSYMALFGLLLWQAFRGQSITAPDSTTLIAFAAWAVGTVAAVWLSRARSETMRAHAVVY